MLEKLFTNLESLYPELVAFRRDLHMYPELSFEEITTPQKVADFLTELGIEVKTQVGTRGVVGLIKGGKPGKTVALRADFDALPIQDEKNADYKSRVPGVMHACGHDIHTAALLGVAKVLSEVKEELEGNVVLIHQFAEEQLPGGAKSMIEDGCLEGVDVVYGAHVMSHLPIGQVGVKEGHMMAAYDAFEIEIFGKGSHGAMPHLGIDPVVLGSQLVTNLQQIVSRRVDPLKPAVVTVGSLNAGQVFNVIPDTAKITGTVRTFDPDVRDLVEESIKQIAKSTCEGAGARVVCNYTRGYPPVVNHPGETQRVEALAKMLVAPEDVLHLPASMGGEDFAYYLQKVPGTFFNVGGASDQVGPIYPHHHPKFDVDERSMLLIGKLFISSVLHYLSDGKIKPEHMQALK
ncbi:amidohydrolase [Scopulibacillus darangshiensis]|uniref:Amidohydrolase n=1 Tax=Scopulibacillus darangshiensis TaxID=442528 RepID=A0A4R2NPR0_9BACL|nr:M20 family metallopeptidase [Scopulibacillus darangshiensis]TCP23737.1 amidohydrolase [Scopulibacillus darangshiensis]